MGSLPCEAGRLNKWRDENPLNSGLRSARVPTRLTLAGPCDPWARLGLP